MIIEKEHIGRYIPQRDPFIMVDELVQANDIRFVTKFYIDEKNLFLDHQELREFALIENICQSSAAGLSYTRRNSHKRFKDGFLGGIKNLKLNCLPRIGETITTEVEIIHEFENMFLISGSVYQGEELLLTCEVKLAATY